MLPELKLRKIGDSVGVVLPEEALAYLKAGEGDLLYATEAAGGALRLTLAKADLHRQMHAAREIVARYRDTLGKLAK